MFLAVLTEIKENATLQAKYFVFQIAENNTNTILVSNHII